MESMFGSVDPFQDEIDLSYMNVDYADNKIASIYWFDEDSIKFSKVFHYDKNDDVFLISELRESVLVKEYYFTEHNITDRFLDYLLGNNFIKHGADEYITEVLYNQSKLPVSYIFKSISDDYIGHVTILYDDENFLIRESWFQGRKKIREFTP